MSSTKSKEQVNGVKSLSGLKEGGRKELQELRKMFQNGQKRFCLAKAAE